jgi:hypothetical protein
MSFFNPRKTGAWVTDGYFWLLLLTDSNLAGFGFFGPSGAPWKRFRALPLCGFWSVMTACFIGVEARLARVNSC